MGVVVVVGVGGTSFVCQGTSIWRVWAASIGRVNMASCVRPVVRRIRLLSGVFIRIFDSLWIQS